jgi:tRNA pseudouridine38-40 synthase
VAYDGTEYAGFQIQRTEETIQGQLERVLQQVTCEAVRVHGAGRTDAGVHAQGQVISFRSGWRHGSGELQRALNALLPESIGVDHLQVAPERFHARFSATSREYVYNLCVGSAKMPLVERYAWRLAQWPDVEAMRQAAAQLVGEHDFAALGQPPAGHNTVRRVLRAEWQLGTADGLAFRIEATAFLRSMVRRIVGTLMAVGTGTLTVEEFGQVLAHRDISRAAPPAPARGLCLWQVRYGRDGQGR